MPGRVIKCVVWDLDGTLWNGSLIEGTARDSEHATVAAIHALDERGILNSIASKNEPAPALERLRTLAIEEYFLFPYFGWGPKSDAICAIARNLRLNTDAVAFVDDQEYERHEVQHALPDVLCFDPSQIKDALSRPEFNAAEPTRDARRRRLMIQSDVKRNAAGAEFSGPPEVFLQSLKMKLTIANATGEDLLRAEELTIRTNQLNTTGRFYTREQLAAFLRSPSHELLVARLEDRFGDYGTIGLVLLERMTTDRRIRLFLLSCRVMARGIAPAILTYLLGKARATSMRLTADFTPTKHNRIMMVTYRFFGFQQIGLDGATQILQYTGSNTPNIAAYLDILDGSGTPQR